VGVPVPEATQWDQLEHVGNCASPIFKHFERLAAQGEVIYQDDTPARILSLIDEHQEAAAQGQANDEGPSRTGMYTTALIAQVGESVLRERKKKATAGRVLTVRTARSRPGM
jgi:hypothetical protein